MDGRRSLRSLAASIPPALACLLGSAAVGAQEELLEAGEASPLDRLDRAAEQGGEGGSDLWIGASVQARAADRWPGAEQGGRASRTALGAGIVLGGSFDAFLSPPMPPPEPPAAGGDDAPAPIPSARLDATLARGAVAAALARDGAAAAQARLEGLAARSRTSASLPELRLRVMRVVDEDQALAPTEYDPGRTTASGGSSTWLEARGTWRLDRWVFAREELTVERLRQSRARATRELEREVLAHLSRWQRAHAESLDPEVPGDRRVEAELEALAAEAALDVWTDGWFGRELARRSRR